MRSFRNIGNLLRSARVTNSKNFSQLDLSLLLGYKNGQFISNVERGLCSIPLNMMVQISELLEIDPNELKAAILKDHEATLTNFFNKSSGM